MTATVQPGVYEVPEDVYHADKGSLSVSGAKKLLPPSCPARFKWDLDHGQKHRAVFDFGHAAHAAVLGVGAPVEVIHADDWRGKAAREARDAAYAAGKVPLLAAEAERVDGMAAALRRHEIASSLLDPSKGKPEQSLYMPDPVTGVMLRGRLDWLPDSGPAHLTVPDFKTAASSEPGTFARAAATFRYHMQAAFYSDLVTGLGLAEDVTFQFIVIEKTPPYVVSVVELDTEAIAIGRALNRTAIDLYADCLEHDRWPGYVDGVELVSLPFWATSEHELDVI